MLNRYAALRVCIITVLTVLFLLFFVFDTTLSPMTPPRWQNTDDTAVIIYKNIIDLNHHVDDANQTSSGTSHVDEKDDANVYMKFIIHDQIISHSDFMRMITERKVDYFRFFVLNYRHSALANSSSDSASNNNNNNRNNNDQIFQFLNPSSFSQYNNPRPSQKQSQQQAVAVSSATTDCQTDGDWYYLPSQGAYEQTTKNIYSWVSKVNRYSSEARI
jgi:hypothetical protein